MGITIFGGNTVALTSDEVMAAVEGDTIASRFLETAATNPDWTALRWRGDDGETYEELTYAEYRDRVARVVAGYRELGIGPGSRVVLMMRNIAEFHVLDMAVYFCGATAISIYNSSSVDQISYIVGNCDAEIAIVEDAAFLERVLEARADLPALRHIGIVRDPERVAPADVFTAEWLFGQEPVDLDEAVTACGPDDLATMIYTSGTTGPPKGVMISHRNVAWTAESIRLANDWDRNVNLRAVSYLPMAHIAERLTTHYSGAFIGLQVTVCPDMGAVASYFRDVHPQLLLGVPRVWEKIHAGVTAALAADPEKEKQFGDALAAAWPIQQRMDRGTATEEDLATWAFLDEVAFGPVRGLIGMDAVEVAVTSAAPIPPELIIWFRSIGVPLSELYGLSETSGPLTWARTQVKPGWVGPAIPGCEVRLADDGELIGRGGNIFLGYFGEPDKTAEVLDDDGWFYTGDIAEVDDEGYFRIIDRKKEIIVTAGGKNVSPANLEAALKMIPLVGQAAAIGDGRRFVSALVTLDPDVSEAWALRRGIPFTTLAALAADPDVVAEIDKGLEEVMAGFNHAEQVKKVKVLGEEWLPDSDVLTPTSKLKRRGIKARYAQEIEDLYAG